MRPTPQTLDQFENISSKACIETYATYYLSGHGNLLLITDDNAAEVVPIVPTWYEYDLPSDNMNTPFKWQVQSQSSALSPNALIPEQDVQREGCRTPEETRKLSTNPWNSEWYNSQLLLVADTGRALQITVLRSNTSRRHYLQRHQMRCHVFAWLGANEITHSSLLETQSLVGWTILIRRPEVVALRTSAICAQGKKDINARNRKRSASQRTDGNTVSAESVGSQPSRYWPWLY